MISKEQKFFIQAVSDFLGGKKTSVPDGLDLPGLIKLAQEQQCDAVLAFQTGLPELDGAFAFACHRTVFLKRLRREIDKTFADAGIPYIIFKGPEIAQYYTVPEFRSMGDLDILVHPEDKQKARRALLSIGCETDDAMPQNHEWLFRHSAGEIELHHALLYADCFNGEELLRFAESVWENAVPESPDGFLYHLCPEFLFLYALLHLRKHLLWAGTGIRPFLDLAMMIRNCPLDWTCVSGTISALHLDKYAGVCFELIRRWFGVSAPVTCHPITEEFFERATAEILGRGVHGLEGIADDTLIMNEYTNRSREGGEGASARFRLMLRIFFPPFSAMREKYPAMAKSRILLPVLWGRRMAESICCRRAGGGFRYAVTPISRGKEMDERLSELREWGIDTSGFQA